MKGVWHNYIAKRILQLRQVTTAQTKAVKFLQYMVGVGGTHVGPQPVLVTA